MLPGRHAEEQVRLAQRLERLGALPVGLGNDADAKALRLQHAADHRHAEARVVDVGVARDQDDVAAVPAELLHLGAAHGQERGRAEALGPVRAVAGQRLCGARKKGDVDGGVHGRRVRDNPTVYDFGLSLAKYMVCAAWPAATRRWPLPALARRQKTAAHSSRTAPPAHPLGRKAAPRTERSALQHRCATGTSKAPSCAGHGARHRPLPTVGFI